MSTIRTRMALGAALAALAAAPAYAGDDGAYPGPDASTLTVHQVQEGDTDAAMDVTVPDHAGDATAIATATGNTAAGLIKQGEVVIDATQRLEGDVNAASSITGGMVSGHATASTTAYGNATSGGTWDGNTFYRADQVSDGDVTGSTVINLEGAGGIATTTTAIANVSNPASEYGDNRAFQTQTSNGSVLATTDADLCCDGSYAAFSTVAAGNTVTSEGYASTVYNGAVQITAEGESIRALSDVYIEDGHDIAAASTASGNSYSLHNDYGYATLGRADSPLYQGNGSAVDAQSYVTLDNWSGFATSSAYGVGNSALIGNSVSNTGLYANQENIAGVNAQAWLTGASTYGGTGMVNATAIGNAATATLCAACENGALMGGVSQKNTADIRASARVRTTTHGSVIGSATAVGNSATFQSSSSHGH